MTHQHIVPNLLEQHAWDLETYFKEIGAPVTTQVLENYKEGEWFEDDKKGRRKDFALKVTANEGVTEDELEEIMDDMYDNFTEI